MQFNLYRITCLVTGDMYVGKTTRSIEVRWQRHVNDAQTGSQTRLHRTIRKYGKTAFTVESILLLEEDITTEDQLNGAEIKMIRLFRVRNDANVMNLTSGGEGMSNPSPETRARLSASRKGHSVSVETRLRIAAAKKGKKQSTEHLRKLKEIRRGRTLSAEWKRNISQSNTGKTRSLEVRAAMSTARMGHSVSDESKAKMSAAKKGKKLGPQKTHCKNGHERVPANVYASNGGCRECARVRSTARYAAHRLEQSFDEIRAKRSIAIKAARSTSESRAKTVVQSHVRWHANRGIINPECVFCQFKGESC